MKIADIQNKPECGSMWLSIQDNGGMIHQFRLGYALNGGPLVIDSELECMIRTNGKPLEDFNREPMAEHPVHTDKPTQDGGSGPDPVEPAHASLPHVPNPLKEYGTNFPEILRRNMSFELLKTGLASGAIKLENGGELSINAYACVKQTDELMRALAMIDPYSEKAES